ncbi:MAG: DUF5688 family protein [Roseburia faecis]|nr:DUF5688 family protein [Roseburia faecis]
MTEFSVFAERLTDNLVNRLREDGYGHIVVDMQTIETEETANVKFPEYGTAIRLNLAKAYRAYLHGYPAEAIVDDFAEKIGNILKQMSITDYSKIKDKLAVCLVPTNWNLSDIPHGQMADLPFACEVRMDNRAALIISNALLCKYGIPEAQLFHDAFENAERTRPAVITGMSEMLLQEPIEEELVFIATTPDGVHGAGVLAYPGFLDKAAKQLGGNFYVFPSSIHEVILAKDNGNLNASELDDMVRNINNTEVPPEERLSDNAYHYDSTAHIFELAKQFARRKTNEK